MSLKYLARAGLRNFAIAAAALALCGSAGAHGLKTLYAFDGTPPQSAPVRDAAGNLYGTTGVATQNLGTIYRLSPGAHGWTLTTLYSFTTGAGLIPSSPLIVDGAGNLYGTAAPNGVQRGGEIFRLSPDGAYKVLHRFAQNRYASEGALTYRGAAAGLPYDGTSPLYGPSAIGGRTAHGTVFSLTPNGATWDYEVIYTFCRRAQCRDGWSPFDTLTMDGGGNLYGVTASGGKYVGGVAFKLAPAAGNWKETVLYDFCAKAGCPDGSTPISNSATLDAAGNLIGTTFIGGRGDACCGVAYKLAPDGTETVLHAFCPNLDCSDGSSPFGGLTPAGATRLLGVTNQGGTNDAGAIFALSGQFRTLYSFCAQSDCADGSGPLGSLAGDGHNHFYGVTVHGGGAGSGTVFEFTP
ncbi:MAG: hypothetical protein JOZ72_14310 [Alphaproteobacteria bacterium]|nr:hypothetical protein [Alphaproteobacteria bacterium]